MSRHEITRDITYATSANSRSGRALIRVLENATGRIGLIRRAEGYEREVEKGRSFWQVIVERYGLTLELIGGSLTNIPANGPLIVIANHPYGILDGLMMGHVLDRIRGDFRILANSVFRKAEALDRVILPISFAETREAIRLNLETRAAALDYLAQGGGDRRLSRRHGVHRAAPLRPAARSGLAQLHRQDDRPVGRDGGADLL
jgi:putative hemolysin